MVAGAFKFAHRGMKMSILVEIKLSLAEEILRQLHEHSLRWGVSEDLVVEQALGLLFAQDEPSQQSDYWFSATTMRKDWDAMPVDWYVEADNGLPTR
jgi:hypothetical protein